jgi:rare lipoprotein A
MTGPGERQCLQVRTRFETWSLAPGRTPPASESTRYNNWSPFHFNLAVGRLVASVCLLAVFVTGCAGRRTVATRPPGPVQPDATITAPLAKIEPNASSAPVRPSDQPSEPFEEGKASWYGAPFHGRRASNGEVYDMNRLTAAHRTLPFNTVVRVTNMTNGKSTTVRITDRGPFVDNRIIDLSFAAAKEIESVGPGVVPVRLDILSAIDPTAGYFTVQIGAFRERANADRLRTRLSASYSPIQIVEFPTDSGALYRVRVGKVSGEQAAQQLGEQLRDKEGVKPIIFRLDDTGNGGGNP